ncbi:NAD-dependent epimerase/dehydratase family protein [Pedobacter jamesrossensis]|uniref:NAD-dependent epimerase/dehydratase family protein n=1 Tax=Pedobacter jamesrossensis TaxID=1908238 RepID=A0ABV8NLC5_9SPHI
MKKRVLITGATGFVGYHLIKAALANELEVYISVRSSSNVAHLKDFNINYVHLDFELIYQLRNHIDEKKYDYIIHAAATTKAKNREEYFRINATYTRNLALAATESKHKIKKMVFVSSLAARGPLKDDADLSYPVTLYGNSKALAETYLSKMTDLPLIVFRPTAVYGPREKDILILIKSINSGLELYVGKQQQKLSFVYVTDLAEIIIESLHSKIVHRTYNVSDGMVYDKFSLANYASKALHKKPFTLSLPLSAVKALAWSMEKSYSLFNKVPALNMDKIKDLSASNWACDIENLKEDFGFEPKYQLENGLNETIAWYKENKWL